MNFFQSVEKIKETASHALHAITTEEATKTALILPMLSSLGYDIFNPYEVIPEMDCDLSRGGDKVDYAISIDGHVRIIIECKHHNANLSVHAPQLMKYYAASDAKCGILTNGIEYWFYSDTVKQNIMDKEPFLKFNLLEMGNDMVEQLHMFSKEKFSESAVASYINSNETRSKILKSYRTNVVKMSDELIALVLQSAGVEHTEENTRLCREVLASETGEKASTQMQEGISLEDTVRAILADSVEAKRIFSVKYKEHETVFMDNQSKWLCRAYKGKGMVIFYPASEDNTKDYSNPSDLTKYSDIIASAVNSY